MTYKTRLMYGMGGNQELRVSDLWKTVVPGVVGESNGSGDPGR